jgi:parallel beta-helix repeat protein
MKKFFRRSHSAQYLFYLALVVSFLIFGAASSWAIVVTTTADDGTGSLREAIIAANADHLSPNTITFDPTVFPPTTPCAAPYIPLPPPPHDYFGPYGPNVAVPAPGTIVLTSQLPIMTGNGDSIDGTGACVVIDGRNVPTLAGLRVRARDVTIQGLTFQNFIGNDAVLVDARDSITEVTGVLIRSNQFYRNRRAVRVTGGEGTMAHKTVRATVSLNTIQDVESGISVQGNDTDDIGPGNRVDALVGNNLVQGTFTPVAGVRGDGINISGGTNRGSNNEVNVTVGFNTVRDVVDDGITAGGCGRDDTGSNNFVQVTITSNTVAYFVNGRAPEGIVNDGIIVFGSGGESAAISNCKDNTVRFLVSTNTVNGFPNSNIRITGGDEGTSGNDVAGDVLANTVMNSGGNTSTPNIDGNGIQVSGGSGTTNMVHNINICGNGSQRNFNRGISISGGSGTGNLVENINICGGNTVRSNGSDGIVILGGSGPNNIVTNINVVENDLSENDDGIFVSGGDSSINTVVSNVSITGNQSNRNLRDGIRVSRGDATNIVLLSGITNNTFSRNAREGIGISSNVPGAGNTPISGNRCDSNGEDGIDINSDGYSLSNNTCNGNTADGINALGTGIGGNLNDGGNRARRNAACNEPNFCF